jgi:hypothetical protein
LKMINLAENMKIYCLLELDFAQSGTIEV